MTTTKTKTRGILRTETLLTDPSLYGLTTATPAQRAICRAIDGLPIPDEIWEYEDRRYAEFGPCKVADIFGGVRPTRRPKYIILLSGVRCGKSRLIGAVGLKAALWGADLSDLGPGEVASVSIVSHTTKVAKSTFRHILGGVQESPALRRQILGKPKASEFSVQHLKTGKEVAIRVVALQRTGNSIVGDWSAGVIIDEAPRQVSGEDGFVLNIEEQLQAASHRIRKGAQIFMPGSPVGPSGYIYSQFLEHFGKPGETLVIRAPAYLLNPYWWTVEAIRQAQEEDPDLFRTECLGEFRGADGGLIPPDSIELACRDLGDEELPYLQGRRYFAAMDPATRTNAWTFAVGYEDENGVLKVAYANQWIGTRNAPLKPSEVFKDLAVVCRQYGVQEIASDQHHFDSLQDVAKGSGLRLREINLSGQKRTECYEDLRLRFLQEAISIPDDRDLRNDLAMVRKRVSARGLALIHLPQSSSGRHCDYAACLALLNQALTYTPRFPTYDPSYNRYLPGLRTFGL